MNGLIAGSVKRSLEGALTGSRGDLVNVLPPRQRMPRGGHSSSFQYGHWAQGDLDLPDSPAVESCWGLEGQLVEEQSLQQAGDRTGRPCGTTVPDGLSLAPQGTVDGPQCCFLL